MAVTTRVDLRGGAYRRSGYFGAWHAVAALPAVVGGALFVLVLTSPLSAWQLPVMLLWLSGAFAFSSRVGERIALRALAFRRPSAQQRDVLGPVSSAALERCGFEESQVDWYVRAGSQPNACVAGRRSVAVTEGALSMFVTGGLSRDQFVAILIHELGHHATRATRFGLATRWLAAPGRLAFRGVFVVALVVTGRRRLGWGSGALLVAGSAIALGQSVQHHEWASAVLLAGLISGMLGTPLLVAMVSRSAERAADRLAIDAGVGQDLAQALLQISSPRPRNRRVFGLLDSHPSLASRVAALTRSPSFAVTMTTNQIGDRCGWGHGVP
jgi:STE24 endopeptidase